jgi:hypothetical protein
VDANNPKDKRSYLRENNGTEDSEKCNELFES